ncbi:MAG: NADH-quinone oxidoreductase subunit M [Candidatus Nanopelagicales bacterium]
MEVTGSIWLPLLIVVPLLGGIVIAMLPRENHRLPKQAALFFSVATLVLSAQVGLIFDVSNAGMQLGIRQGWIPAFGVNFSLGVDGIALVMVLMTTLLVPICIVAGWFDADGPTLGDDAGPAQAHRPHGYFAWILILEALVIGVFTATDVFLFYVLFEAMLVPMYFLIGHYGVLQRQYAAMKFFLYSLAGGLLMLVALIWLYVISARSTGTGTFDYTSLVALNIDPGVQKWLFLGFFIAFAIKAPLWPLHTWLPDAAAAAQPSTAVLLVGVLDKVGTFGMLRLCLPLFPDAAADFAPVIMVLAVIGIVYGALLAIGQTDLMRLIAYTSVSHFGFIALGIFALTIQGQSGATFYMFNHGFSIAALFLVVGFLARRRGARGIADFGGVAQVAPLLAGVFLMAGLSSLALPGMSSFVSEFLVLAGTFGKYPALAIVATGGIILAALYILIMFQRTMTGPAHEQITGMADLSKRELLVLAPVIAIILALGFFPQVALRVINPSVTRTITQVQVQEPAPTAQAGTTGVQP